MPSLPPAASAPLPAPAPPAPVAAVRWVYVDRARAHQVHVGIRGGGGAPLAMFVHERGNAGDALEREFALEQLWESRVHHLALEERLTLLGEYFRSTVGVGGGWTPVRRPPAAWTLDLTPLACPALPPGAQLHFYGSATDNLTTLLLALPLRGAQEGRFALTRLDLAFPDAAAGKLTLLHPSLGPVLLRSALAEQDRELQARRLQKVVTVDRASPRNAAWCRDLDAAATNAYERAVRGAFGGVAPRPAAPPPAPEAASSPAPAPARPLAPPAPIRPVGGGGVGRGPARVITQGAEPVKLAAPPNGWKLPERLMTDDNPYAIDYDPTPPPPEPQEQGPTIEQTSLDLGGAISHPRILKLHAQFFPSGEDAALLAEGELAIRAAVQAKRATVPRDKQHLLSIVEASLLVRHSLAQPGRKLDTQAADLLRRALVYLG